MGHGGGGVSSFSENFLCGKKQGEREGKPMGRYVS